jgi:hypothetical protein
LLHSAPLGLQALGTDPGAKQVSNGFQLAGVCM